MQLHISGHHLDITSAIKNHTNEKLSKIKHHFDNVMNVNMILEVQKDVQKAEATIHLSGADLFAKAQSSDMYVSIDQLINKLDSQIIKHKEKLHNHRG
ncbi:MAG: ribosome-associated translation inhibitor RaiA [Gammaproteobacteria bacterium]|mgnify:FL=1|jgi:putative sigma-54 modulation protein|nr:ribosome-associated translation inhibitor RaiA [Gammaproteobacteria bacterium]MDG1869182.1 ribosome-associated translation inhibitor RaiA [Candidatus Thioglobus sp.]|tara:strand:- start:2627 stop:2920 length:294 start_codon:yes stop_codon:yes gene_type:complete